jgi:hypothetical protein
MRRWTKNERLRTGLIKALNEGIKKKSTIEAFRGIRITLKEAYHVGLTHMAVFGAGPGRHLHYERDAVSVTSSGLEEKEPQRT